MLLASTPSKRILCITHLSLVHWLSYPLTGIDYEIIQRRLPIFLLINVFALVLSVAMWFDRFFNSDFSLGLTTLVTIYVTLSVLTTPITKIPRDSIVRISMAPALANLEFATRFLMIFTGCINSILRSPATVMVSSTLAAIVLVIAMLPLRNYFWLREDWETLP